jgi:diguanylate cyclase (GGDEF)-like protein/PAS domain S-box-containing protein
MNSRNHVIEKIQMDRETTNPLLPRGISPTTVLELCADVLAVVEQSGNILFVNQAIKELLGRDPHSLVGLSIDTLLHPEDLERVLERMAMVFDGARATTNTMRIQHHLGYWIPIELTARSMTLEDQTTKVLVVSIRDVSERETLLDRLQFQATHDSLTGLLSLEGLYASVENRFEGFAECFSVLRIDADGFQRINEFYGHRFGDTVMARLGRTLEQMAGPESITARLGGDDFVVLVPCQRAADGALPDFARGELDRELDASARKLLATLVAGEEIDGVRVDLAFRIGVAYSRAGDSIASAIAEAEAALQHAKVRDVDVSVFDSSMREASDRRRIVEASLRRDLARNANITLDYQPVLDAETRKVVSFEGLARWTNDDGEKITPNEFIPIAEATGLMGSLTQHVLGTAISQLAKWQRVGLSDVAVSVNVPVGQLQRDDFVGSFVKLLAQYEVKGENVIIEVTESSMMERLDVVRGTLDTLRAIGCGIAIDDFGTGYSSFGWLRDLPVDYIKLDRSFVAPLATDPTAIHIVRSMVDLCNRLGFKVVAEGVETRTQADMLTALGVSRLQGFHFSAAVGAHAAGELHGQPMRNGAIDRR